MAEEGASSSGMRPKQRGPKQWTKQRWTKQRWTKQRWTKQRWTKQQGPGSPVKISTPQPLPDRAPTQNQSVPSTISERGMKRSRPALRLAHSTASPVTRWRVAYAGQRK